MFFESSPRPLQRISDPLERQERQTLSLFISWGNFLPLLLCSPDASLYFNKPWMSDGYSPHTGSQEPYRCTTLPLTALYQREAVLCKLHWPLFLTPDGPPLLTSFLLPFFSTLSFRAVLFVLMSCSWKRKSPSFRPPSRSDTHRVTMETLSGPQREESPVILGQSTMQMMGWMERVEWEDVGSGRKGGIVVLILSQLVLG